MEAGAVSTGSPIPLNAFTDPPSPESRVGIGIPLPLLLMTPLETEAIALSRGLSPFTGSLRPQKFGDRPDLPRMPVSIAFIGPGNPEGKGFSRKAAEIGYRSVCLVGFAAGLSSGMDSGTVRVLSRFFRENSPPLFAKGAETWSQCLGLDLGNGVTVDRIVSHPGEKKRLNERTLADMADMESYPWFLEFRDAEVTVAVIRVVSDGADTSLPPVVSRFVNVDGRQNLFGGIPGLVRDPGALVALVNALPGLLKGRAAMTELGRRFGRLVSGEAVHR